MSSAVVVGPEMPFEAGEGKRLADFGSHSDDMILLVERAQPVGWMIFGLRNGAAAFLSLTMDAEAFNQMLRGTHVAGRFGSGPFGHWPNIVVDFAVLLRLAIRDDGQTVTLDR